MNSIYYTLFFIAFPIMCLMSNMVVALLWFLGEKKNEAIGLFTTALAGAIIGYVIAIVYFSFTRSKGVIDILDLSVIGLLVGAGYLTIIYALLPENIRNVILFRRKNL